MDNIQLTTPFGRRGVNYAHFANQMVTKNIKPDQAIDKWKLFRTICEAKPLLNISDRALAVLNALLSFYPKNELKIEFGMVVFPSNEQISLRAHGMAEQTLRRHLTALVEAGLILRKDSPNGKRYARKDKSGNITDAFGFSLAPLLARSEEFKEKADTIAAQKRELQQLKEKISLHRRSIMTFIETAQTESISGNWSAIKDTFDSLNMSHPRNAKMIELVQFEAQLADIYNKLSKLLENNDKTEILSGNECQNERHIKSSESESNIKDILKDSDLIAVPQNSLSKAHKDVKHANIIDLSILLKACPEIIIYGPNGSIRHWSDLKYAVSVVTKMFNIPLHLLTKTIQTMGEYNTLAVISYILQKGASIECSAAYLVSLNKQANADRFDINALIMSLMRTRMSGSLLN